MTRDIGKSAFIDNFFLSYNAVYKDYIKINDVLSWQSEGRLNFSISNGMIPPNELQSVDVSFEDNDNYRWRGHSEEEILDVTILKSTAGYSGIILNHQTQRKFYILPVNMVESVMIEVPSGEEVTCGDIPIRETSDNDEDCYGNCPGHVDLLFLMTPEAETWLVEEENYVTYLDLMIAELYLVFGNDDISHTVDYSYTSFPWIDYDDNCSGSANDFANDPAVQQLRQDYHADIVVYLVPPEIDTTWSDNLLACVPWISATYEDAYILLPIDKALQSYIFVHEIGHTFGAQHVFGTPGFPVDCSAHYSLSLPAVLGPNGTVLYPAQDRGTVLRGFNPIPHYSDPYDYFFGIATGEISTNGTKETNNAGRIRTTGCKVAAFELSPKININVVTDESIDCTVIHEVTTDWGSPDDFEYEWSWSYEGFFSTQYPGTVIGESQGLVLNMQNQPVNNPDLSYFIQVVVSLNGTIVDTYTFFQQGGICNDYEDNSNLSTDNQESSSVIIKDKTDLYLIIVS